MWCEPEKGQIRRFFFFFDIEAGGLFNLLSFFSSSFFFDRCAESHECHELGKEVDKGDGGEKRVREESAFLPSSSASPF